jgi:hypothetical protein
LAWLGATSWRVKVCLLALVAFAVFILVVALSGKGSSLRPGGGAGPASKADAVPYDGRSPRAPAGEEQRVIVALPRPALGELPNAAKMKPAAQRAYVASLNREAFALRSALGARGVKLRGVVNFERTFDGFAATIRTSQLADLASLGVRPQPARRLYPALSEPVPAVAPDAASEAAGQWKVASLAGGVDPGTGIEPGYDAVDRDRDPKPGADPRAPSRVETSGTALADVLKSAGAQVVPIRIASLQAAPDLPQPEELATSDQLLSGLEHAVDPNQDGATDDHVGVALVGVNAPYAGFAASPEAQAARGAAGLGTIVVAGAGQEGPAAPGSGTIGSPAAGADVLAVGALASPDISSVALKVGDAETNAALLGGRPPTGTLQTAGPLDTADLSKLLGPGAPALQGRLVVVRAGDNPPARVAAAAAAGAKAVLLADERDGPLAAMPAGRVGIPVLGVSGDKAADVLKVKSGAQAQFGALKPAVSGGEGGKPQLSPFSSQGPAASAAAKPDLVAPGAAVVGGGELVGGTAVAAARVAAAAARLQALNPKDSATQIRTTLASSADPSGLSVQGAGAGVLRPDPAIPGLTIKPPRPAEQPIFTLTDSGRTPLSLTLQADNGEPTPATLDLRRRDSRQVTVTPSTAPPPAGYALGRLRIANGTATANVPWAVPSATVEPVPVGALELQKSGGKVRGLRFAVGAFERGDPQANQGTKIVLAERLELVLLQNGKVVRRLTPPGGARELLPAEYAYTLEKSVLAQLQPGTYRFRARAWAPRQTKATAVTSEPFKP